MKTIQLTRGQIALVDDEDYEELSKYYWQASLNGRVWYAQRAIVNEISKKKSSLSMHRQILKLPNQKIDHIDRNGLNNQKNNLRLCTTAQNGANRRKQEKESLSKHKGVTYHKRDQRWQASIRFQKIKYYLGYFSTENEAALAYNKAASKFWGEFADLNIVEAAQDLTKAGSCG